MPISKWQYQFEYGDSVKTLASKIEELGAGGWELVNVVKDRDKTFIAMLKRPVNQDAEPARSAPNE
jgi:hypothetical protein